MREWITLFADDGRMICRLCTFRIAIPLVFYWFAIMGIKVKWKKVRGGTEWQWVGYFECVRSFRIGISALPKYLP